jgi:2-polyprenyl-6-methoxyphenol hydroxylase-like FAD-dependent oxidoreductase
VKNKKIIIIGGGIGGLMTAIALNEKGISSTVFERNSFNEAGAGLGLWANATRILHHYGILAPLLPSSSVLNEMRLSTSSGKLLKTIRVKKLEDRFQFPSIVALRRELQKQLLNALPPDQVHFGQRCLEVSAQKDKVIVKMENGPAQEADAVIFADGIHSFARKEIFGVEPVEYSGKTSWRGIAHYEKDPFEPGTSYELFGKGKRAGIFPLPGKQAYWYVQVNMPEKEAKIQINTSVADHLEGWSEQVHFLVGHTPSDQLIHTPIYHAPVVRKLALNNMALLGDAAHPMTPDLGQGACQAIEDAEVIAACVSKSAALKEGFLAYEAQRLPRVRSIVKNSFRMGNLRQMNSAAGVFLRDNLFRFLPERFSLGMLEKNIRAGR